MGRDVRGPEYLEGKLTAHLESLLASFDVPIARQTDYRSRDNLIARLDGARRPRYPVRRSSRHGPGGGHDDRAVDSSRRTRATVRTRFVRHQGRPGRNARRVGAVGRRATKPVARLSSSLHRERGTRLHRRHAACASLWSGGAQSIIPRKPDMAIVAEPTRLDVVVAHKGMVRWRCRTHGRAAHSSLPHLGDNAIFRMASVLAALERYQRDVVPLVGEHPLCGRPTLECGHDPRWHEREHRARPLHDRNRPPPATLPTMQKQPTGTSSITSPRVSWRRRPSSTTRR